MAKSGRRRRGRRGRGPGSAQARSGQAQGSGVEEAGQAPQAKGAATAQPRGIRGRRRRRRGGRVETVASALASMDARPKRLRTLPPDGLVLEELISEMQSNHGTPATPQEYRLIIRTPPAEEKE